MTNEKKPLGIVTSITNILDNSECIGLDMLNLFLSEISKAEKRGYDKAVDDNKWTLEIK